MNFLDDDAPQPPTIIEHGSGAPAPSASAPPPGGQDNYVMGGEIARGGMGCIMEAADTKLKRTVAMKLMLFDANADAEMQRRFLREAEVLAVLAHPNIVPVYDIVWDDGAPLFYTMKRINGRTLQAILHDLRKEDAAALRDFTLDRLLLVFRKVCDALAFAHSKGIIHRDLKPENIMIGEFGEVLVMDWGIAKTLGGHRAVGSPAPLTGTDGAVPSSDPLARDFGSTMQGSVMGTPQYMSPEQARGEIDSLDERSDIFSLGGILYAILTLRPPVEGATLEEVLTKVRSAVIAPLDGGTRPPGALAKTNAEGDSSARGEKRARRSRSTIPPALSSVVMKALRLEKAQRYQSVAEFSADIEAYQTGFATKAERAGLATQLVLLIKRHKGMFATAAAAWLVITALAVWFVIHLRAKERRAVAGEASARAAEAVAVAEKEAARQSLARSALNLAEAAQREGHGPEMQAALNDVPEDLRDSTWNYLLEQSDTSIARVRTDVADIRDAAADPRRPGVFAVADGLGKVTVLEVRTGVRLLEFTPGFGQGNLRLAFSTDGGRIAVGLRDLTRDQASAGIAIYSARDGRKLLEWDAPFSSQLEFSPDGRLLLQTTQNKRQIQVWEANSGQPVWSYPPAPDAGVNGVFSADGQQVVTSEPNQGLRLVQARDGTFIRALPPARGAVRSLTANADGAVTAAGVGGTIMRIALEDGRVLADFHTGDGAELPYHAVTPDGRRIVTVVPLPDGRQNIRLWNARTGATVQSLVGGSGPIKGISVHPLSGELLIAGTNARAWSLTGTPERWILHGDADTRIAFWGADDLIVAPATPSTSGLIKLQTGSASTLWEPAGGIHRLPAVSADGRLAALARFNVAAPILLLRNPGEKVERVATFKPKSAVDFLALSPTGDRLVVIGSRGESELFDTGTGLKPVALESREVKRFWDLRWMDGQRLLGLVTAKEGRGTPGSEEWIVIWDATTGKILQTVTNRTALGVLALAPDGRRFAEAGADKKVRVRDAATLAVQQEFRAHDGPIVALAWHPTQPILATTSADLAIRVWNLDTGRRLEELRGPLGQPHSLVFSPSGQRLACSAEDGITRIWELESLGAPPPEPSGK